MVNSDDMQQFNRTAFSKTNAASQEPVKLDKWDVVAAISSGALTSLLDIFWIGDFSLIEARDWGKERTNAFVIRAAGSNYVNSAAKARGLQSFDGGNLSKAIEHLEKTFPSVVDQSTNQFGGGLQHHLRDFGHHPTITGLLFSIVTQFSGHGFGTDEHGNFICPEIEDTERIGKNLGEKIYLGTINWAFHLISDMAGSSGSRGSDGTGIPGPLLALFKEISSLPMIKALSGKNEKDHYNFSVTCSKLFNGTLLGAHDDNGKLIKGGELKFDMRTEIGLDAFLAKQSIPVLINEFLTRAIYSIRRFSKEIEKQHISSLADLHRMDVSQFRPWNSKSLSRMLLISSTTFSVMDISAAGVKAALTNKSNKAGFAADFLKGINYIGVGRFAFALSHEAGIQIEGLQTRYLALGQQQLTAMQAAGKGAGEGIESLSKVAGTGMSLAKMSTPVGFVSLAINVYQEISGSIQDLAAAREDRLQIEFECAEQISIIRENRIEMEEAVSSYMTENLLVFSEAFNEMDRAIMKNDSDSFIGGNVKIQKQMGNNEGFKNQKDFDDLMASDDFFKL